MPGGGAAVAAAGMEGGKKSSIVGILMASFAAFGASCFSVFSVHIQHSALRPTSPICFIHVIPPFS
ncbi:hypothetical protein CPB86DRAFT_780779 [Serendipita vermifera]|nr:hypothetical protein CPB86DRAFT_780779 [Serendipita vermifera]